MDAVYPSDLTDAEWDVLQPLMPKPTSKRGRPREIPFRQILNGIFYLNKEGCQWRALPTEFGSWKTVYHYFRIWRKNGRWQKIQDTLVTRVRTAEGRNAQPSAAIIDSQSAKTTQKKGRAATTLGRRSRDASVTC